MSKTKSGYFFLSFALLMVAILTPVIMVTSMNDLGVKTSINLYKNRIESRSFGLGAIDNKFETFLSTNSGDLLGLFEKSDRADVESEESQLQYLFNSKSTLIPTNLPELVNYNSTDRGNLLFDPAQVKLRTLSDGKKIFVDLDREFNLEQDRLLENRRTGSGERVTITPGDPTEPESYPHILPAAGTGNATGLDCDYYSLNLNLPAKYPDLVPITLDPANNPCNFNKWNAGESIMIPLYNKTNAVTNKVLLARDQNLAIRLKTPCTDAKEFCAETERKNLIDGRDLIQMALVDLENDKVWVHQSNLRFDSIIAGLGSKRFTELGIVINGDNGLDEILRGNEIVKPALVLKLLDNGTRNFGDDSPFTNLEYQVVSNVPFADNKVIMTASVWNNSRLYDLGNRMFTPETNVDLGVVFGN